MKDWIPVCTIDHLPELWALQLERAAHRAHRFAAVEILRDHSEKHPPGSIGYRWAKKILRRPWMQIVRRKA